MLLVCKVELDINFNVEYASEENLDTLFEEITFIYPSDTHVFIHIEEQQKN